jgi:predicted phosphodiesterase
MKLFAISDLHVSHPANWQALERTPRHPEDWLILAGDVGETAEHLDRTLALLADRFARLVWVPGNHELWTRPVRDGARGARKYAELLEVCWRHGALTPEDPYVLWEGDGGRHRIAPLFLLYDYSFGPDGVSPEGAVRWALESGILCSDEYLLHPDPFPSRAAWCEARCSATEKRLEQAVAADGHPLVLVNHFPLRRELAQLPRIPRFAVWCGTERSRDWHVRFRAGVVVSGHLHLRSTQQIDGVRFEEVSFGYPGQWRDSATGVAPYLRQILPAPDERLNSPLA